MRDGLEIIGASAFVSVIALFLMPVPARLGEDGAGSGGEQTVSVKASSAAVERMVASWETPPETEVEMETAALAPPEMPQAPPAPVTDEPPAPNISSLPVPDRTAPEAFRAPELDTTPPAPPPPRFAPEASPRPPERPAPTPEPQRQTVQPPAPVKPPHQQQASQASAPRAQQQAKGIGGGATQGQTQKREQASISPSQRATLMSRWGGQIQARIARRAPRGAGKGTAYVTIRVAGNGALVGVGLARSSGNPQVDQLALQAVRSASGFPRAPQGLGAGPFTFSVPIASR
ncbi:TonB family protein [Maritimibacter dapengensis]|uniref:TonB family protein n=1 Tax=Maritimibacter dapengensis TaxID=2836868 RepID=A0ABS6SZQ6_9RHOB|nr:TonB family protein [Maritimibacter dapengensis]MBV7378003.1 TonB family protein [Maritimibacter dapengensis]